MDNWFTIDKVDSRTYMISEYRHWEETHCYLLNGSERSLLIDTGLGISNIHDEVKKLTDKPITAVATHIHWDHIGGHKLKQLKVDGKLRHGSGIFDYGDWGIWL